MMETTKGEKMFRVIVDGVAKDWYSFEFALTDALSRGFGNTEGWSLRKLADAEVSDE